MTLRVGMFAPLRDRCGVSDYSELLAKALNASLETGALKVIPAPDNVFEAGIASYFRWSRSFARLAKHFDPFDLVHIQHQYFLFGGVSPLKNHFKAFADRLRKPAMMTVHEIASHRDEDLWSYKQAIDWVNRTNFRHPALKALIVHTKSDADELVKIGVPSSKIHRLVHPVPLPLLMPDQTEAHRRLGLSGKTVVTLFGFIAKKKGHLIALETLARLPEEYVLLIAGDRHPDDHTDYVSKLKDEIRRLQLTGRVIVTGFLPEEEIPVVMSATDIAIAPYLQTSGSGSLANFLSYGRPIIASDIPPHRELLSENANCMSLFEAGNSEELSTRIQELAYSKALQDRLIAGCASFAQVHSYLEMARKTVSIYMSILDS